MSADAQRTLRCSAKDLGTTSLARIPRSLSRVCFLVINSNRAYRAGLGTTPLERGIACAELLKSFGYEVFFMEDPHCLPFKEYLSMLLERTSQHFFFIYLGQGGDPGPETFIFNDEPLPDADFLDVLDSHRNTECKVTLFSDFVLGGSVFEREDGVFKPKTVLITCSGAEELSEEGPSVFVEHFVRELTNRDGISAQTLFDSLRIVLKRHQLQLIVKGVGGEILSEPVAIFKPPIERNQLIR
jgi:hypothetical protein